MLGIISHDMKLRIKSTNVTLKIIGWMQIIGGIAGLGVVAYLMLQTGQINGALLLIFLTGIALFSYSIYAGKRLLTDFDKLKGILLSLINQAIQVFQWTLFGYGLSYSTGAEIALGIQENTFKASASIIMSTFKMSLNSDDPFRIKVNILAVVVIAVLLDIEKELQREEEIPVTETLG